MQMLERAGERLRDLDSRRRGRIVRKAMVLAVAISELGLEKKLVAADGAVGDRVRQRVAQGSFEIVLALIGRIERAKAGAQRERDQLRGAVFLPRGAVDECWGLG